MSEMRLICINSGSVKRHFNEPQKTSQISFDLLFAYFAAKGRNTKKLSTELNVFYRYLADCIRLLFLILRRVFFATQVSVEKFGFNYMYRDFRKDSLFRDYKLLLIFNNNLSPSLMFWATQQQYNNSINKSNNAIINI